MSHRLNLMIHAGGHRVERQQVIDCPTPPPTDTWHPIPHNRLFEEIEQALPRYNLNVVETQHALHKDGQRYFGLIQVSNCQADQDFGLVLGLRNSHDKSFPAGLCVGSGVFVCDNLAFSSEVVIGRRHTTYIERDLPALVAGAMGKLLDARVEQQKRIDAYKTTELGDKEAHNLMIETLRSKGIMPTRINDVIEQWHTPKHPEFAKERNVWRLFNGFTEALKESALAELPKRTQIIHGIMDRACGLGAK